MSTYSFDGLLLDDPQGRWRLNTGTGLRIIPARVNGSTSIPGTDGVVPAFSTAFEASTLPISLNVKGADCDELDENLDVLRGVFGQRHAVRQLVDTRSDGRKLAAGVVVSGSVEPQRLSPTFARMTVLCTVPGVFWRDLVTVDAAANVTASTATTTLTTLAGTTGSISDSLIRFRGGFSTATVTDPVSGDQITVNAALAGTEYLVVDTANWVARKHTTDSWSTTAGANAIQNVVSNRGSGPMLALNPDFTTGAGRVRLQVKGINVTGSPTVEVRAKRSFL